MAEIGYTLSSEEFGPRDLVRFARRAEEIGFSFVGISDHFHPWIDSQGQSPFVWSVIGGVAAATERIAVMTGVTCPLIRTHPAIVAQAAATSAAMLPGRFWFGVGTGENLNEHVLGDHWPPIDERLEMLEEAVDVIRKLWTGELVSHRGDYYEVQQARIYTLPDEPPPIYIAAKGPRAGETAGRIGDGLIGTSPDEELFEAFDQAGGEGKPKVGQLTVCWAAEERQAAKTLKDVWPNSAIPGELSVELPLPRHFEQASQKVTEHELAESIPCGPDPEKYLDAIRSYADGGFTHVYLHQVGPDQDGFFSFFEREVLPKLG